MSDTFLNAAFLALMVAVAGAAVVSLHQSGRYGEAAVSARQPVVVQLPAVHVSGRRVPAAESLTLAAAAE